jgi:hypothetical protein
MNYQKTTNKKHSTYFYYQKNKLNVLVDKFEKII